MTTTDITVDIALAKGLPDRWDRVHALNILACKLRDMNDIVGFDTATDALMGECPRSGVAGLGTLFNETFTEMYGLNYLNRPDDTLRVLRVKGKDSTRTFALRDPDEFAAAHLQIVQERLDDGGLWYDEAELLTGDVPDAVMGNYLLSLYTVVGTVAGEKPHQTFGRWEMMPEMAVVIKECRSRKKRSMVVHALVQAVRFRQDYMTAFLGIALTNSEGNISPGIARLLTEGGMDNSDFPLSRELDASAEPSPADEARAILALARERFSFRHAGRMAARFLRRRSEHEYEEVELDVLNKATFPIPS